MTWTNFWTGIGNCFQWVFEFMRPIGNKFNYLLWVIIFALVVSRIWVIAKQTKEAKRNGTLQ